MRYNPDVHHRRSIRLPAYDYAQPGAYFVTVCTHLGRCTFDDPRLKAVAEEVWRTITSAGDVTSDEFVVMPNHVHGIVWISGGIPGAAAVGAQQPDTRQSGDALAQVWQLGTEGAVAAPLRGLGFRQRPVMPGSLAAVVRAYKSATAKRINNVLQAPGAPVWQRNYWERIIRNDWELDRIRQYIRDNPRRWAEDPDNPANVTVATRP